MKTPKSQWIFFIIAAVAAVAVPLYMVIQSELAWNDGTEYRFRCAAYDPFDPFRGSYVRLRFDQANITLEHESLAAPGDAAYAVLGVDSIGFAQITHLADAIPAEGDYITVEVRDTVHTDFGVRYRLELPFTKYFMEENKAPVVETKFRGLNVAQMENTWAVVSVRNGHAVTKDLFLDGTSANELAAQTREGE
ncbi:MAG: GDYXXLXY domain-containing protein [Flavobacteriales bacterium]|nr:GDYXXLXY domain-containing protein [Flavobacteriales bacterium]